MSSDIVVKFPLEEEYRKPTGIRAQDISALREWLQTQPHLPGEHITDLELILTYHCCGRSSEVSKQVLDLHYTLRTLFTSFFKDRRWEAKVERQLTLLLITPLAARSKEGHAAFYCYFMDRDPKHFVVADAMRSALMVLDLWQYEEGTWPGFIIVFDFEQMTFGHFTKIDLQSLQQFLFYLQEAMLVNLKGIHVLNAPSFMDKLMMLMKPFMKKELLDMFHIYQVGSKELNKYYPMEGLPKGAGGNYKPLEELRVECFQKVKANEEFFIAENKKRVVEAKRPGKPKTISDIFGGVEGSFKKLDID